ncbi:MAG: FAD-dependent oxidoreductase [Limnohabitans sp.]|nr:FAD-dependent oxidoreductase [Limnohabitans sp.]
MNPLLIAGGGIGGMALALALTRQGQSVHLFERGLEFSQEGAGIQLGPNATRLLNEWGLADALRQYATFPDELQIHCAQYGHTLATKNLSHQMEQLFGAPYVTLHRADLHDLLMQAVASQETATISTQQSFQASRNTDEGIEVDFFNFESKVKQTIHGSVLIGSDGVQSDVRQSLLGDGPPTDIGHVAYRSLLSQKMLPKRLHSSNVHVWLGPRMHMVVYPVRGGVWLNVVLIVKSLQVPASYDWTINRQSDVIYQDFKTALKGCCNRVQELVRHIEQWKSWKLVNRPAVQNPLQLARGKIALIGDAAHPILPYLAQGAGMAIEDAHVLSQCWVSEETQSSETKLHNYAKQRYKRVARVQKKSSQNSAIFHADGVLRHARDLSLRLLGLQLIDMPWLYAGPD